MGDFFLRLGQSISNTSNNIKTSFADSKKKSALRRKITSAENRMADLKMQIGTKVYEAYINDDDIDDFSEICKQIDALLQGIKEYRKQVLAVDGIKLCPNCGLEISFNSAFCSHCGKKQDDVRFADDVDDSEDDIDDPEDDIDEDPESKNTEDDGYLSVGGR